MGDLELRAFELEFDRPISKRERFMVKIVGKVYLGHFRRPGWTGEIDFYLFKCDTHDYVVDYPHGHNQILRCPICLSEKHKEKDSSMCKAEFDSIRQELRDIKPK